MKNKKENKIEKQLVKIGEAARMLGTVPATLRLWERTGEVLPARKTAGGTRYYDVEKLQNLQFSEETDIDTDTNIVICFTVSDKDRKMLKRYCEISGKDYEIESENESENAQRLLASAKKLIIISLDICK